MSHLLLGSCGHSVPKLMPGEIICMDIFLHPAQPPLLYHMALCPKSNIQEKASGDILTDYGSGSTLRTVNCCYVRQGTFFIDSITFSYLIKVFKKLLYKEN